MMCACLLTGFGDKNLNDYKLDCQWSQSGLCSWRGPCPERGLSGQGDKMRSARVGLSADPPLGPG